MFLFQKCYFRWKYD